MTYEEAIRNATIIQAKHNQFAEIKKQAVDVEYEDDNTAVIELKIPKSSVHIMEPLK